MRQLLIARSSDSVIKLSSDVVGELESFVVQNVLDFMRGNDYGNISIDIGLNNYKKFANVNLTEKKRLEI